MQRLQATPVRAVGAALVLLLAACGGGGGGSMGGGASGASASGANSSGNSTGAMMASAMPTSPNSPASGAEVTNTVLTSDGVVAAPHVDVNLKNPWGVAMSPTSPIWVANNATNTATLYDGNGVPQSLVVTLPAGSAGPANPTGQVFNGTTDFMITEGAVSAPAQFLMAGEGGTILGWSQSISGANATIAFDSGAGGAVYKGLALASNGTNNLLYATDFHNARVDMFDTHFHKVNPSGSFTDPSLPAGFAPFGIQAIANQLYVTYAKQDAMQHDDVPGAGLGYVSVFDANGNFLKRLISAGPLNAPWGIAMAPPNFGSMGGALLIGNFGDGKINAFDPGNGNLRGSIAVAGGQALVIQGLWSIVFGNGAHSLSSNALYYTAGPNNEADGIFGRLEAPANVGMSLPTSPAKPVTK